MIQATKEIENEQPNPHRLSGVCRRFIQKLGLEKDVDDEKFSAAVETAKKYFSDEYGIPYRGELWQEILASRKFIKIIAGEVLNKEIKTAMDQTDQRDREIYFAWAAEIIWPKDEKTMLGGKTPGVSKGDWDGIRRPHLFFDPSFWDIKPPADKLESNRFLRLVNITSAMLLQEDGIRNGGADLATFAKMTILARKEAEGKGPKL